MTDTTFAPARASATSSDAALLAGRLFLVALYLWSAFGKWADLGAVQGALTSVGFPLPGPAAVGAATIELGAAAAVAFGWRARTAAWLLVGYSALATVMFHDAWNQPTRAEADAQLLHLFKNVGLIGGFLLLIGAGPGALSLDALLRPEARDAASGRPS